MFASSSLPARAERSEEAQGFAPSAGARIFTPAMLAACDGSDARRPVLIGYAGRVYDVSASFLWMNGRHFWLRAGRDLTDCLAEAPHGAEMLEAVPCVGVLAAGDAGESLQRNGET